MAKATAPTVVVVPGEASQELEVKLDAAIALVASGEGQAMGTYTFATVPDATLFQGRQIEVTDGLAGAWTTAVSDGTIWRGSTTGTVITDS